MIYLITGVPGSGKTLYAVSKLLQQLMNEKVPGPNGEQVARRLCIDNIPGLLLPHELMAPGEKVRTPDGKFELQPTAEGDGVWNWHMWCKPGDVIVIDEVQRWWRPRGMNTKPGAEIAALETHRHLGVDIVLLTQNPMLLDQNVRRLVGRHQHVRRLFGGARALIYEWDGCQTDTSRLAAGTRTLFTYPKSAYKLYHSSELHTKQRQKIPLWFGFPLVVLALGAFAGPKAYDALTRSATGKGITSAAPSASAAASSPSKAASAQTAVASSSVAAVGHGSSDQPGRRDGGEWPRKLAGCIAFKGRCECFGDDGVKLETDAETCEDGSRRASALPLEVGTGRSGSTAPRPSERDCDWFVPMGASAPEVRCWTREGGPSMTVVQSSLPPAQGADGATMGPASASGDSARSPPPRRGGVAAK